MKIINHNKLNESISNIGAVERIANNIDKIKDVGVEVHADLPYAAAAQIAVSKEKKDAFDKAMKEKEDEVKDFTQDRETAKVSTPAMKKMHLSESLFEDFDDDVDVDIETKTKESDDSTENAKDELNDDIELRAVYIPGSRTHVELEDLYDEIMDILDPAGRVYNGRKQFSKYGKGQVVTYFSDDVDDERNGIKVSIDKPKDEEYGYCDTLQPALDIVEIYKDLGVTGEYLNDTNYVIWVPDKKAPHRRVTIEYQEIEKDENSDGEGEQKTETETKVEETPDELTEDIKVTKEIYVGEFEGWSGAEDTLSKIQDAGKMDEFENLINEMYPEGIDETDLNDLLRFEDKWLFDTLGITVDEDSDDEDSDDESDEGSDEE